VTLENAVVAATALCFAYLLLVYVSYGLLIAFAAIETAIRSRDARAEAYRPLEESRFTIPVSVLLPAFNEADMIEHVVDALRDLRYPKFELIVVDDGSTDDTFAVLQRSLELEPVARFEQRVSDTEPVHRVLRSGIDPRVLVIQKENGGKADALNCALNHARYRHVCCVDGDTSYFPNALLDNMRLVMRDPARVVGVTAYLAVVTQPELHRHEPEQTPIESELLVSFQHLDYARAFLNNRIAWSRLNFMLCAIGAFGIWRRDVLVELGAFSREFTCEDIELTFRVHEHMRRTGRDYKVLATSRAVGRTEGPTTVRSLVAQRERWQRVTLETLWHYRRMFLNPRYGSVGLIGTPLYVLTEILAPFMELLAVVTLAAGVALHLFDWRTYLALVGAIAVVNALFTTAAVLTEELTTRSYGVGHLLRLIALAPLELALYRPICSWARIKGCWRFFRGDRSWRKFERNTRLSAS
jgi:biofilm PGA synthesis N-glycosyltransferase PgaC